MAMAGMLALHVLLMRNQVQSGYRAGALETVAADYRIAHYGVS